MINKKINFLTFNVLSWIVGIIIYYYDPQLCAIMLLAVTVINAVNLYKMFKSVINVCFIFNVSFLGTLALACFQFLGIEKVEWALYTWGCFAIFHLTFYFFSFFLNNSKDVLTKKLCRYSIKPSVNNISYLFIVIFTILSVISFALIVMMYGYIPLFSMDPNAYVNFGADTNLSLFYQISVILPGMCMYEIKKASRRRKTVLIALLCINMIICVLVKSRDYLTGSFLILFVVYVFTYFRKEKIFSKKNVRIYLLVIAFVGVFFYVTSKRNYSVSYYNYIYKAENSPLPTPLIPIYAYITTAYYNFDKIVKELNFHTYGLMATNPLWILFHVYPIREYLHNLPTFYIIREVNMYSSLGVPFFDFGFLGVALLGTGYGYFFTVIEKILKRYMCSFTVVMYGIAVHHLVFVFFTSWISSFQYFIYTIIIIIGFMFLDKSKIRKIIDVKQLKK